MTTRFLFLALFGALLIFGSWPAAAQSTPPDPLQAYRQKLDAWHAEREKEVAAPDGWLSLVALDWLKNGVNTFGSAPDNTLRIPSAAEHMGMLTVSGSTVQILAPRQGFPPDMQIDGGPAREGLLRTENTHPSTLTWHGLTIVVLPRGDRYILRVKDANAPARAAFRGLHWYAPDLHNAVEAHWIPYNPPHMEKIATVVGTTLNLPAPGAAEFRFAGKTLRLEPVLESPGDSTLFFILRDATSQTTTYQAGRFLRTPFPDHGLSQPGTLVLDFNQLYNPPCAYTPYATCPLPPEQNRLPVPIEAGEQRYAP